MRNYQSYEYEDEPRKPKGASKLKIALNVGSILFTLCGGVGMIEELEDQRKPQAANPFAGVEFGNLEKEAKGKRSVSAYQIDCHLANSRDFRATTTKGTSVDGRAYHWTNDLLWALKELGVPNTKRNIELALILMHRESRMDINPSMNVGPAFKRKKEEMIKRIRENVPSETLQDIAIGIVERTFKKYEKEINEAKTEVEVYNALIHIHNDFSYEARLAKMLIPYDPIDEKIATLQDEMRVNTLGVLQVNPNIAIKYYATEGHNLSYDQAVDWLYTLGANMKVGFATFFTPLEKYKSMGFKEDDAIRFAFADYNAGIYSSRNAAFQKRLGELTGSKLATDGDLLIYEHDGVSDRVSQTELAVQKLLSQTDVRAELLKEKAADFDQTEVYRAVMQPDSKDKKARKRELAIVPDAKDPDAQAKYGKGFSAKTYTDEAMAQVKNFRWKTCK